MFGNDKTYFSDSPVIIEISGLKWPENSPFDIVHVEVVRPIPVDDETQEVTYEVIGDFHADTGGQSRIMFDISSALRTIWCDYDFTEEVAKAQATVVADNVQEQTRAMRRYFLHIFTEYLSDDDGGVFTVTECEDADGNKLIPGGQCIIGGLTEWERSLITNREDADVSSLEHTGVRNGDASTKPTSSPERVGINSITSWVDVMSDYTKSIFYPSDATPEDDDEPRSARGWDGHAPIVLRDSIPYTDFLFVNRKGALETCSAQMLPAQNINIEMQQFSHVERPTFILKQSLMSLKQSGPRREWSMSSGYQTREWVEWWVLEFLASRKHWMLYQGRFVPVIVEPEKKSITIYDRAKQQMLSVGFTVTLALEG